MGPPKLLHKLFHRQFVGEHKSFSWQVSSPYCLYLQVTLGQKHILLNVAFLWLAQVWKEIISASPWEMQTGSCLEDRSYSFCHWSSLEVGLCSLSTHTSIHRKGAECSLYPKKKRKKDSHHFCSIRIRAAGQYWEKEYARFLRCRGWKNSKSMHEILKQHSLPRKYSSFDGWGSWTGGT